MPKPTTFLFTFVDEATGEFADITAPNESAARLWLGGDWIFADRCPMFAQPSEVGDWEKIVRQAQAEAAAAFEAMNNAAPKLGTMTAPEALMVYNEAGAKYEKAKARVTKLLKMSVTAA
jgi:hypothetical protein